MYFFFARQVHDKKSGRLLSAQSGNDANVRSLGSRPRSPRGTELRSFGTQI